MTGAGVGGATVVVVDVVDVVDVVVEVVEVVVLNEVVVEVVVVVGASVVVGVGRTIGSSAAQLVTSAANAITQIVDRFVGLVGIEHLPGLGGRRIFPSCRVL